MAFRLNPDESIADGIRRIAIEQVDEAVGELGGELGVHEKIHQVRKRCKKLRGLVRLIRRSSPDIYQVENARFRDAARRLSFARDAESILEAFDKLIGRYRNQVDNRRMADIRAALGERRREAVDEGLDRRLEFFAREMNEAREDALQWRIKGQGFAALAGGLKLTYRSGAAALLAVRELPTTENVHEWRKHVKYHWYHVRLLAGIRPQKMKPRRKQLRRLADRLGDEHDLAVLRLKIAESPPNPRDADFLIALIDRRRIALQAESIELGQRLYRKSAGPLAAKFGRWFRKFRKDRKPRTEPPAQAG